MITSTLSIFGLLLFYFSLWILIERVLKGYLKEYNSPESQLTQAVFLSSIATSLGVILGFAFHDPWRPLFFTLSVALYLTGVNFLMAYFYSIVTGQNTYGMRLWRKIMGRGGAPSTPKCNNP